MCVVLEIESNSRSRIFHITLDTFAGYHHCKAKLSSVTRESSMNENRIHGIYALTLALEPGDISNDHDCGPVLTGPQAASINPMSCSQGEPLCHPSSKGNQADISVNSLTMFSGWVETPTQTLHPLFPSVDHTSLKTLEVMSPSGFSTEWGLPDSAGARVVMTPSQPK